MFAKIRSFIDRYLLHSLPKGTAQNPEIIDPAAPPSKPRRWSLAVPLIKTLLTVSVPAVLALWACAWLVHAGISDGAWGAWFLLILLAPLTFVLSLAALIVDSFTILTLIALLTGRSHVHVQFSTSSSRPARTVHPSEDDGAADRDVHRLK